MSKAFEKILERLILESSSCKVYKLINPNKEDIAEFNTYKKCIEIVKEVAEEYNGSWIPCSERLPKYGEVVMCSCTNSGITISCITHKGVTPSKSVRFGQHSVIAWQPLPEPFKERD